jgi:hypothetical protein
MSGSGIRVCRLDLDTPCPQTRHALLFRSRRRLSSSRIARCVGTSQPSLISERRREASKEKWERMKLLQI